jgi:hypothetical protein
MVLVLALFDVEVELDDKVIVDVVAVRVWVVSLTVTVDIVDVVVVKVRVLLEDVLDSVRVFDDVDLDVDDKDNESPDIIFFFRSYEFSYNFSYLKPIEMVKFCLCDCDTGRRREEVLLFIEKRVLHVNLESFILQTEKFTFFQKKY